MTNITTTIDCCFTDIVSFITFSDVPRLPPMEQQNEEESQDQDDNNNDNNNNKAEEEEAPKEKKNRKTSGPKVQDPYEMDEGSILYPIIIALALFIPTLLCLCKL